MLPLATEAGAGSDRVVAPAATVLALLAPTKAMAAWALVSVPTNSPKDTTPAAHNRVTGRARIENAPIIGNRGASITVGPVDRHALPGAVTKPGYGPETIAIVRVLV